MHAAVWVVLPTYNEAQNLENIVRAVLARLEDVVPGNHAILVVDDDSPDGTGDIADALAAELHAVDVLHRPRKEGLGKAYLAGFERALAAGATRVVEMDADFSHDPAHLPSLLEAAEDADLVLGSRYVKGGGVADWGLVRRLVSRGGGLYARTLLGLGIRDLTGGYKCIRREVLESIELETLRAQGYVFQIELTYRACLAGFRVREVPIVFRDRREGESKMSPRVALEAVLLVPRLRRLRGRVAPRRPAREQTAGAYPDGRVAPETPTVVAADADGASNEGARALR
jgi:dolichol-phosphate mannosyltransferase